MKFEPGRSKTGGRKPGTVNRRSRLFQETLAKHDFCPITALIEIYKIAMQRFVEDLERVKANKLSPMESEAAKYLKLASDAARELASYAYPKLKSIESERPDPLADMNAQEKLEAMREAVKILEAEVKAG